MSDAGFVKSWRDDADNPHLQDPEVFFVYHRLRLMAVWDEQDTYVYKTKQVMKLQRGQVWTTTRDLAARLSMSKSKIGRILKKLKTGTLIDTDTGTGVSVITLCDYDRNQGDEKNVGQHPGHISGHAWDSGGTQNKEDKEFKEIEERGGSAREPETLAQPPPIQIVDQGKNDGSDPPAKEPVPDVLPDAWVEIARTEFVGVDELHQSGNIRLVRCFFRFQKRSRDRSEFMTQKAWIERWREWLLDDFELATGQSSAPTANGSAASGNGHDPPVAPVRRDRWPDFYRLMEFKYRQAAASEPGNLQLNDRNDVLLPDRRKLKTQAMQIAEGKLSPPFGLEGGPTWGWPEIYDQLEGFDGFVLKACPEAATKTVE